MTHWDACGANTPARALKEIEDNYRYVDEHAIKETSKGSAYVIVNWITARVLTAITAVAKSLRDDLET